MTIDAPAAPVAPVASTVPTGPGVPAAPEAPIFRRLVSGTVRAGIEELVGAEPLVWADVERQFERADRMVGRAGPAAGPGGADSPAGHPAPRPDPDQARDLSDRAEGDGPEPT